MEILNQTMGDMQAGGETNSGMQCEKQENVQEDTHLLDFQNKTFKTLNPLGLRVLGLRVLKVLF
jgi:hypothetical protein